MSDDVDKVRSIMSHGLDASIEQFTPNAGVILPSTGFVWNALQHVELKLHLVGYKMILSDPTAFDFHSLI